jgi:hypothetical protein
MRLMITAGPHPGVLRQLLPLARAARDAGHQVAVCAPEQHLWMVDAGLAAIAAGTVPTPPMPFPVGALTDGSTAPARELATDDVLAAVGRWSPELVVHDADDPVSPLVAALRGVAAVPVHRGPGGAGQRGHGGAAGGSTAWETATAHRLARHGVRPPGRPAVLDMCPPSLRRPDTAGATGRIQVRPQPYAEPGTRWQQPDFGRRRRLPVVWLAFCPLFSDPAVLDGLLSGLRGRQVNVIASVPASACGSRLWAGERWVHFERHVPAEQLLPVISAVVTHGDEDIVLSAMAGGLPTVLLPRTAAQRVLAERASAADAAVVLRPGQASPETIGRAVTRALIDPVTRVGAGALRREIAAMDPPEMAIAALTRAVPAAA